MHCLVDDHNALFPLFRVNSDRAGTLSLLTKAKEQRVNEEDMAYGDNVGGGVLKMKAEGHFGKYLYYTFLTASFIREIIPQVTTDQGSPVGGLMVHGTHERQLAKIMDYMRQGGCIIIR